MTIDVNFRVVWKKDKQKVGTVIEVIRSNKIRTFKILWDVDTDDLNDQNCANHTCKSNEIMEHYQLKTLSSFEKLLLVRQRDKIVENNLKQKWKILEQTSTTKTAIVTSHTACSDTNDDSKEVEPLIPNTILNNSTAKTLPESPSPVKVNKIKDSNSTDNRNILIDSFDFKTLPLIEPTFKLNKFCKFDRKTRVADTLSRFYYDIDNEKNGGEDDDDIHNPNFPYINKREMRFYFFNFGNELFENNLIQRLNEDNRQWKATEQYAASNKRWNELELINDLLGISLLDREYEK